MLALRFAAWLCVGLIAYLSLTPLQVRTPAPAGLEHAVAYAGTASLMGLAYPSRSVWLIIGSLAAYGGLMELLQHLSPGRNPGLDGVLWSSAGAFLGGWTSDLTVRLVRRVRPPVHGEPRARRPDGPGWTD